MSICRYCGEEITFRYIDGRCVPLHPYGTPCGERVPYSDESLKRAVHTRCPRCSQMVWLVHHNGGSVWVNELGWPWPKHGCFDGETDTTNRLPISRNVRLEPITSVKKLLRPSSSPVSKPAAKMKPATASSRLPDSAASSAVSGALDERIWRKCEFCSTVVETNRYDGHVAKRCPKRGSAHRISPGIVVFGIGGKSVTVSRADLSKSPQHTVNAFDNGTLATFEGVLLLDLLANVDLPTGDSFHNTAGWYYVLVEGDDGNRAVFAWAEIDPSFLEKPVYVVTKRDGKPLPESEGPFQLVVPDEKKRTTRWIRQVRTIRVRQAN